VAENDWPMGNVRAVSAASFHGPRATWPDPRVSAVNERNRNKHLIATVLYDHSVSKPIAERSTTPRSNRLTCLAGRAGVEQLACRRRK